MNGPIRIAHVATVDLTARFVLLSQMEAQREAGYEVTVITANGPWVADIRDRGIRHIAWPGVTRSWDPRRDLKAFVTLRRILLDERFDLVHTHNPKPGVLGRVAARTVRVPCVVNTVHGFYATPDDRVRRKGPVMALEWMAARCSDLELYQSEEDIRWARKLHVAPRCGRVLIRNGVDIDLFAPASIRAGTIEALRAELGLDPDDVVVGTVGRAVEEKGFRDFARASAGRRGAGVRFVIVGEVDPVKKDSLSREELEASGVILTGWRENVHDLLAMMDVFVLPSWREGVPRSAIEAAAAGKPLVLTNIRGCREIVRHGREGYLVPPKDLPALDRAIGRLVEDEPLRRSMGRAARERAVALFDERDVVETILRSYERGLRARRGVRTGRAA